MTHSGVCPYMGTMRLKQRAGDDGHECLETHHINKSDIDLAGIFG